MERLSIVIPSYNQAQYLSTALDSVFSQQPPPYQVIVVDGGSLDGTVALLETYASKYPQLEWLSEPDDGPADAVNKGLGRVSGDIIGIQSSDDIYYPGAFAEVTEVFARRHDVGFVYGDVCHIDRSGNKMSTRTFRDFSWSFLFGVSLSIPQGSIFFRKVVADKVGGWNPDYYSCDIEYWLRLLFNTNAFYVRRELSGWRRHNEQRTTPAAASRIWPEYGKMIATSKEIAAAPFHIRRKAYASRHILAMRIPPKHSRLTVWKHLIIATLIFPSFWFYNPKNIYLRWLPGYRLFRRYIF